MSPGREPVEAEATLVVPAALDHVRFARLLLGGVASRADYDVETIEDLQIAIGELCSRVVESLPADASVTIHYVVGADGIRVDATADRPSRGDGTTDDDELVARILERILDHHNVDLGSAPGFSMRKRAANRGG